MDTVFNDAVHDGLHYAPSAFEVAAKVAANCPPHACPTAQLPNYPTACLPACPSTTGSGERRPTAFLAAD
jgi:hypothetical protein